MKLLPRPPKDVRVNSEDSLGHGMDAVIMLAIFLGAGYGLDRLFGTTPMFMIILTVIGAVGLFARFYYSYSAKMDEHDEKRLAKLAGPAESNGEAA
jgi:ATP synthase protein I